jgi:hypothetical protein
MSLMLETHGQTSLRNLLIVVAICFVLALVMVCVCWEASSIDDGEVAPASKDETQDFATVEASDGSWAQVYREARGEQRESLELLFRCNIISTDEFAFSSVSQEHIQECIWIATHMLRQKPLEEWVALWQQAQQTFEDSVTACFEARGGAHSPLFSGFEREPPMAMPHLGFSTVPPSLRSNRMGASAGNVQDEDDPYTTRSHYIPQGMQDLAPPSGMRLPDSATSYNTMDSGETRWSIESELDNGLAAHGVGSSPQQGR